MMLHMPAIAGRLAMLVSLAAPSVAFDTYPKNPGIDALNYAFHIELSDTTDAIVGEMTLDLRFLAPNVRSVRLDLATRDAAHAGKGMRVSAVTMDGAGVSFTQANDELLIPLTAVPAVQQRSRALVEHPADVRRVALLALLRQQDLPQISLGKCPLARCYLEHRRLVLRARRRPDRQCDADRREEGEGHQDRGDRSAPA